MKAPLTPSLGFLFGPLLAFFQDSLADEKPRRIVAGLDDFCLPKVAFDQTIPFIRTIDISHQVTRSCRYYSPCGYIALFIGHDLSLNLCLFCYVFLFHHICTKMCSENVLLCQTLFSF